MAEWRPSWPAAAHTLSTLSRSTCRRPKSIMACSAMAGVCGAAFTMPFDVMKTRMMNAKPGTYKGVLDAAKHTLKQGGPMAFYSGFGPAAIRIIPQTVLTWVFKEQLRLNFGYYPDEQ